MYRMPTDFDPGVLTAKYLAKLSFGQSTVHLELARAAGPGQSDLVSVVIFGRYIYEIAGATYEANASQPSSGTKLVALLNQDVSGAKVINGSDLSIEFGSGNRVLVKEDPRFESYAIYLPGQAEIVV